MSNNQLLRGAFQPCTYKCEAHPECICAEQAALAQPAEGGEVFAYGSKDGYWVRAEDYHVRPDKQRFTIAFYATPPASQEQAQQPSVTVRYDLTPAMVEGQIRDKLIELGWTPPTSEQPQAQATVSTEQCGGPLCGSPEFGANHHPLCKHATQAQAQALPDEQAKYEAFYASRINDDNGSLPTPWEAWQASAALAAKQERKPMTRDQRKQIFRDAENRMMREINLSWRDAVVECVEAHHGIVEKGNINV